MCKWHIFGPFHRVFILVAARNPTTLTAQFGPLGGLGAGSGDDCEETSAELRRDDHVEEEVGGRTNGVEEVGNPTEVIQFVRVQNGKLGGAPGRGSDRV